MIAAGLAHPLAPTRRRTSDRLTVAIPVHHRRHALARCLQVLGGEQALVVDDRLTQAEERSRRSMQPPARVWCAASVVAAPAARNLALHETDAELIPFLDSDCIPHEDWLPVRLAHLDDARVAAVASRVRPMPAHAGSRSSTLDAYLQSAVPARHGRALRVRGGRPTGPLGAHGGTDRAPLGARRPRLAAGLSEKSTVSSFPRARPGLRRRCVQPRRPGRRSPARPWIRPALARRCPAR